MTATNFYEELQSFSEFKQLADNAFYREAPDDWFVVLTDISGSTAAIEGGRYKEVNLLGAASIAVVQAELKGEQFPFVFGGDGATFLIPPTRIDRVKIVLQKLIKLAQVNYGFSLRVGIVPIQEVHNAKQSIGVAKFKINNQSSIAMIKGGGVSWAEKKIKNNSEYCLSISDDDLEVPQQLSCRWLPVKSSKGRVLSLLVQPRENNVEVAARITTALEQICDGNLESSNPIQNKALVYDGLVKMLLRERKLHGGKLTGAFAKRAVEIILCWWAFKLGLPAPFAARDYKHSLQSHSDYRKYDDVLRLILDCTPTQTQKIKSLLNEHFEKGEIYYGVHESSHALMTCLVESIQPGGHIHFIDGSSGGYAVAAKQLKKQIAN